ncbi:hypothetical protein ACHAWT_008018 [Skeletonema menzelii]
MKTPMLPPRALHWSIAASTAAAISYADRGTSAIAASSLLEELHWNESQLGQVQSAFFVGYALTQVFGGVLGGRTSTTDVAVVVDGSNFIDIDDGSDNINIDTATTTQKQMFRRILPLSLILTGITTLLFPMAAMAGPNWAILDRFSLGLLEGVLLPAAMAGVSSTTAATAIATTTSSSSSTDEIFTSDDTITTILTKRKHPNTPNNKDIKATASAIVIAGCYLGSAWAYLSAWIIFSESSQVHLAQWGLLQHDSSSAPSVWPLLFYVNGFLSLVVTVLFLGEFDLSVWKNNNGNGTMNSSKQYHESTDTISSITMAIMDDAIAIVKETLSSKSGRAIVAAQIGQGALLYSIASWGPLYLERIADVSTITATVVDSSSSSSLPLVSSTAVAASIAASSLVVPQITQALIGMSIGVGADKLSTTIGSRLTRRSLQLISGIGPAMILVYLGSASSSGDGAMFQSPALLFGAAQTISAISLGAVSVSHLEVATPSKAGAVYALGNVFAAISGSITVTLFGVLLDKDHGQQQVATAAASDFSLPFQIVAILSVAGSIFYSLSIESDIEIGMQETKKHLQ